MTTENANLQTESNEWVIQKHLRIGWWSLLIFLTLGLFLEALHGLKVDFYLNVSSDMRRLMWTLAHAHGTLISLVHIAFAVTVSLNADWPSGTRIIASHCLTSGGLLLPLGFFLGGCFVYSGDPGMGIILVPIGASLLFLSVLLTARGIRANSLSK